jgi:hypothetical protein
VGEKKGGHPSRMGKQVPQGDSRRIISHPPSKRRIHVKKISTFIHPSREAQHATTSTTRQRGVGGNFPTPSIIAHSSASHNHGAVITPFGSTRTGPRCAKLEHFRRCNPLQPAGVEVSHF